MGWLVAEEHTVDGCTPQVKSEWSGWAFEAAPAHGDHDSIAHYSSSAVSRPVREAGGRRRLKDVSRMGQASNLGGSPLTLSTD